MKTLYVLILSAASLLTSCGNPDVSLDESDYAPKLVVEGYLFPGTAPSNIRITRNFRLNKPIPVENLVLQDATVRLTRVADGRSELLVFNPEALAFSYPGTDWVVGFDETWRIDVTATVDGKALSTSSETTTPKAGFRLNPDQSVVGTIRYNEKNPDGSYKAFKLDFRTSEGIDLYAASIVALDADIRNYIFSPVNRYVEVQEKDSSDVKETLNSLKYQSVFTVTPLSATDHQELNIDWFGCAFYGRYRVIFYAMEKNAKSFYLTHQDVQDQDGNFVEPKMALTGDGIGVFGSALADTVFLEVLRP